MRYVNAQEGAVIPLGRQGENNILTVQFDVSDWEAEFGEGTFTLAHQRCMDGDGFEREITLEDGIVSWVITNVDVAYAGKGVLQLTYTVDDAVAKSAFYYTKVEPSLDASETVPLPWKPWVDEVLAARGEAVEAAENAAESELNAKTSEDNAKVSEDNAAESAESALISAQQAMAFVGSPISVNLASAMTDHNHVYVYIGAESGMVYGDWYYWNGSEWADGGVYNAVAVNVATSEDLQEALYS